MGMTCELRTQAGSGGPGRCGKSKAKKPAVTMRFGLEAIFVASRNHTPRHDQDSRYTSALYTTTSYALPSGSTHHRARTTRDDSNTSSWTTNRYQAEARYAKRSFQNSLNP